MGALAVGWPFPASAEQGVLVVHVRLAGDEPVPRLRIGTMGDGSIEFTDNAGRARIRLAASTRPGGRIKLQIVPPPDLAMVSPWDGDAIVPSFDNDSGSVLQIVVAKRNDKRNLENASVLAQAVAAAAREAPRPAPAKPPASRPHTSLAGGIVRVGWQGGSAAGLQLAQAAVPPARQAEAAGQARTAGSIITDRVAELLGFNRDELARAIDKVNKDSVTWRLVVLTGKLETPGDPFTMVVGNVDGRGLSFGPLWANPKDGSLQRLLRNFREVDADRFGQIMGDDTAWLLQWLELPASDAARQFDERTLEGSRGMQVREPWRSRFVELGRYAPFQRVQLDAMQPRADQARAKLRVAGLRSERALAFVYDAIYHQGLQPAIWAALPLDRAAFEREIGRAPDEQEMLVIAAQRAIARVPDAFRKIVAPRRMAFALGQGVVYGHVIDLDDAGFGMRDLDTGMPLELQHDDAVLERLKAGWIPGRQAST